jgi:hypothetical protein
MNKEPCVQYICDKQEEIGSNSDSWSERETSEHI